MKKKYPEEFKIEVAKAACKDGTTLNSVAKEYGINQTLVRNWKIKYASEKLEKDAEDFKSDFLKGIENQLSKESDSIFSELFGEDVDSLDDSAPESDGDEEIENTKDPILKEFKQKVKDIELGSIEDFSAEYISLAEEIQEAGYPEYAQEVYLDAKWYLNDADEWWDLMPVLSNSIEDQEELKDLFGYWKSYIVSDRDEASTYNSGKQNLIDLFIRYGEKNLDDQTWLKEQVSEII